MSKKFIRTEEFSKTFFPNLLKFQHDDNNQWLAQMRELIKPGGFLASPDGSFPTLTKVDGGWEY